MSNNHKVEVVISAATDVALSSSISFSNAVIFLYVAACFIFIIPLSSLIGLISTSYLKCENSVEETLQSILSLPCLYSSLTLSTAFLVSSEYITSWYPPRMCPPVICSNEEPACKKRQPLGILTAIFFQSLSQT